MHVQTHLMSGWCVANLLPLNARERLLCMVAATAPDLDGISFLFGQEAWWDYHHLLAHNLLFVLVLAVALTALSTSRVVTFVAYLVLGHLHMLMDYYGSGPGWGIPYLWPFEKTMRTSPDAWAFYSWQNLSTAGALLAWTLLIVDRKRRTPLEAVMPSLDRQLVSLWDRRVRRRAAAPAPADL